MTLVEYNHGFYGTVRAASLARRHSQPGLCSALQSRPTIQLWALHVCQLLVLCCISTTPSLCNVFCLGS